MSFEKPKKINITEKKEKSDTLIYSLESGVRVRLNIKEILPDNELDNFDNKKAVILIPGWEAEAENKTTISLSKDFANESRSRTLTITSETEKSNNNELSKLYEESVAISNFIKEKNLENIKIVGYSIGGDKAINIAYILQNDPEIKIEGLILLASTGLYNQKPKELTTNLLKDTFVKTPLGIPKSKSGANDFKKWTNVAKDLGLNVLAKTTSSPSHVGKILNKIRETSKLNEKTNKLKIPIILINGKEDLVSDQKKIVPIEEDTEGKIRSREKYLKENLFRESPYIRMLIPSKSSNHGLSYFRSKSIAKTSLYLIDKFYKSNEQKTR